MKLRIKGNSLRLRVTQSDLVSLVDTGRIQETIYFGPDEQSKLTYALEHHPSIPSPTIRFNAPEISVVLSTKEVSSWRESDQVGIYAAVDLGTRGSLEILVEKDFACLDLSDADNIDTFPNPNAGAVC
jgi:hypothetical protein